MEPIDRGLIEQLIDGQLSDDILIESINNWKVRKRMGLIDSVKSAVIGQMFGEVLIYYAHILVGRKENIDEEKLKEIDEIFSRRSFEIISKINELINL